MITTVGQLESRLMALPTPKARAKALEFALNSYRPDFARQVAAMASRLERRGLGPKVAFREALEQAIIGDVMVHDQVASRVGMAGLDGGLAGTRAENLQTAQSIIGMVGQAADTAMDVYTGITRQQGRQDEAEFERRLREMQEQGRQARAQTQAELEAIAREEGGPTSSWAGRGVADEGTPTWVWVAGGAAALALIGGGFLAFGKKKKRR